MSQPLINASWSGKMFDKHGLCLFTFRFEQEL